LNKLKQTQVSQEKLSDVFPEIDQSLIADVQQYYKVMSKSPALLLQENSLLIELRHAEQFEKAEILEELDRSKRTIVQLASALRSTETALREDRP